MMGRRCLAHRQHLDERFILIRLGQCLIDTVRITFDVSCGQNPPVGRDQMRCELYMNRPPRQFRKLLIEFAQMTVGAPHCISVRAFAHLGVQEVLFQRPPCPGHGTFQIQNDVVQINDTRRNQRPQHKLPGCRVATRASHQARGADFIPIKLGQTINSLFLLLQCGVWIAIPFFVLTSVLQPEISRQINDFQGLGQIPDHLLAGFMRQCAKAQVDLGKINLGNLA